MEYEENVLSASLFFVIEEERKGSTKPKRENAIIMSLCICVSIFSKLLLPEVSALL